MSRGLAASPTTETAGDVQLVPGAVRTVRDVLADWAVCTPESPALLAPQWDGLDYRGLHESVAVLAARLRELGIGRQDPLLITLPDGPAFATAILAAMSAGVAAPLAGSMTRHELTQAMANGAARAVVVAAGTTSIARDAAADAGLSLLE